MEKIIVPFEIKQSTFIEEKDFFTFKGHGSVFDNVDFGKDRMIKGAFISSLAELKVKKKQLPVLWQHSLHDPVGVFVDLFEDDKGLAVEGKLPREDTFVHGRVIPQMKIGSVQELSIGFEALEDFVDEDGVRNITKVKLWEISLVTIAMNEKSRVTEMKSIDVEDFLKLTEREMEQKFKDGVSLSSKGSKKFVSALKKSGLLRDEVDANHRDDDKTNWGEVIQGLKSIDNLIKGGTHA